MKKSHVIAVAAMLAGVTVASAQQPPARPIWLIVPFPPGGVGDLVGRSISPKLTEALGQAVLVNNRPGGDTIGGSAPQLAGGWMKYLTGINMTHVPYKGSGPALTDLIGGHISLTFTSPAAPLPFVRSGRLRVLAVTARTRADFLPNVPTVMEAGFPDYDVTGWLGLLAPRGTPRETVARFNAGMARILRLPEIKEQFSREGMHPGGHSSEEFASFLKAETRIWTRAVQVTGLKAE